MGVVKAPFWILSALTLQRHFSASAKFSHVESRFYGCERRGKAAFDTPINPCVRSVCSRSVAVGLFWVAESGRRGDQGRFLCTGKTSEEGRLHFLGTHLTLQRHF